MSGGPVSESRVLEDIQSLWDELRALAHDRFLLAALETQRAGKSLVGMMVAGIMLAVMLSSAWLGLMAAAVMALVGAGLAWSEALLLAVAMNLLFALILWGVIRRNSRHLQFPATLRSLRPVPDASRNPEPS
ncbi:phage holin family protein [Methylotetracoccus oryzae]|uniref:phage holin family protein n=1 Tax=Methylotetracoccus oryzae TaxID=1919059 RepID=UPI001912651D|nr:phage holin family protein [Methylotetracoccus oryzae]